MLLMPVTMRAYSDVASAWGTTRLGLVFELATSARAVVGQAEQDGSPPVEAPRSPAGLRDGGRSHDPVLLDRAPARGRTERRPSPVSAP